MKRLNSDLLACKTLKHIVWKRGKMPTIDKEYYGWCKRQFIPYVRIVQKSEHSNVMVDCPCYASKMDEAAQKDVNALFARLGCDHLIGNFTSINIQVDEVPSATASSLALELFRIALRFGRRTCEIDSILAKEIVESFDPTLGPIRQYDCVVRLKDWKQFHVTLSSAAPPPANVIRNYFGTSPDRWKLVGE